MMGGADVRCRLAQLCNYLKNNFAKSTHLSVASALHSAKLPSCLRPFSLKADSRASQHFVREEDAPNLKNVQTITNGPSAKLPNNALIKTTSKGYLAYPACLSPSAKTALIYPALKNASLLSIGQLCDDNCLALFH